MSIFKLLKMLARKIQNLIATIVATFFYLGKVKYAPGTLGSLAAFPLCHMILQISMASQVIFDVNHGTMIEQRIISLLIVFSVACFVLFWLGLYATKIYLKTSSSQDPKEVIIDEVVGQMLTLILSFCAGVFAHHSRLPEYLDPKTIDLIWFYVMPFALFRAFDIIKPWPIGLVDQKVKGAFGVMFDDVLAGVFASVALYTITFIITGYL